MNEVAGQRDEEQFLMGQDVVVSDHFEGSRTFEISDTENASFPDRVISRSADLCIEWMRFLSVDQRAG